MLLNLYLDEIVWNINNTSESEEFKEKPFILTWLDFSKKPSKKDSRSLFTVKCHILKYKAAINDSEVKSEIKECTRKLLEYLDNDKSLDNVNKNPEFYRIKRSKRGEKKEFKDERFVNRSIEDQLKYMYSKRKIYETIMEQILKKDVLVYVELLFPEEIDSSYIEGKYF